LARRFDLAALAGNALEVATDFTWTEETGKLCEKVGAYLDNDLDTPLAVAALFEAVSSANTAADKGEDARGKELALAVNALFGALGLQLLSSSHHMDDLSATLVAERDEARFTKNWAEADRLRDELVKLGWVVEDSASGTTIRKP
jgi:cysteinyl-tRNA synthetase